MKNYRWYIILIVLGLCVSNNTQAQNTRRYERKDFTFKVTKETNADGEVNIVNLSTYAGEQLIIKYSYNVPYPLSENLSETIGLISEEDINFDGYPDIDINLGYWGAGSANNIQHEALLWDQKQHGFVTAKGYNEIGEPQLDYTNKVIFTVLNSYVDVTKTYYRWEGNTLVEYLSYTSKIEDSEDVDYSGMLNLPLYSLKAKLNDKIPVIIAFQKNDKDIVAGYIYYPRAKNPAPIKIKGIFDNGTYDLNERQSDGSTTGYICLKCDKNQNWSGTWTNPTTHKTLILSDIFYTHEAPKWFTKSLFDEE